MTAAAASSGVSSSSSNPKPTNTSNNNPTNTTTTTPSIGLILPPLQIQKIILKTAEWIARKYHVDRDQGERFLRKLKGGANKGKKKTPAAASDKSASNQQGSSSSSTTTTGGKFPFLQEDHFYHEYYRRCLGDFQMQLREYGEIRNREGPRVQQQQHGLIPKKQTGEEATTTSTATTKTQKTDSTTTTADSDAKMIVPPALPGASKSAAKQDQSVASNKDTATRRPPVATSTQKSSTTSQPLQDPFPYIYNVKIPKDINEMQLEIIKTTAQYVAKNGMQFLGAIAGKHASNPIFEFTNLSHQHFPFFSKLIDVYKKLMTFTPQMRKELEFLAQEENRLKVLDRMHEKAEWEMIQKEKRKRERERRKDEQELMNAVDWQDFVVVATIDFHPEETAQLMMETDTDLDSYSLQQAQQQEDEMEVTQYEPQEAPTLSDGDTSVQNQQAPEGEDENYVTIGGQRVRVRKDAVTSRITTEGKKQQYVKDEITGNLIPMDQVGQHMRASLIHPQWEQQKKKELEKFKTTNLASNTEMANSLSNLVEARTANTSAQQEKETRQPKRKRSRK